ncbi:hypothetical protein SK3146_01324 [Paenibacillus konkukensis]|uniref:Hydrolase n=1 Tax=Paenibacillus konkukensis TaxID=2020716 RepID=A0ABY4RIF1_9BACL|nr:zinc dependent phospholipase C family protein [Paenibacillus konkukensis]UQZ82167.1 hypothetical protein SK3146_01324 [Paenibacillus konkukensis]
MGSRIMHLIIANKIAGYLSIADKPLFLLGGIAPDAVSPKELSHFFRGELRDYSRSIDYAGFLEQYGRQKKDLYILGYYTHLIADDLWLRGFNLPWLKNRMEANPDLYRLYHNDFRLLNGKLLEYYGCMDELRTMFGNLPAVPDLQEVKAADVAQLIPYVLGDMEYDKEAIHENLNVFTWDQIIGYIETSVDKGLLYVKPNLP